MSDLTIEVWITKFALTSGILHGRGSVGSVPSCIGIHWNRLPMYVHKPYWHLTKEAALDHAKVLLDRELASIKKRQARLRKVKDFPIKEIA